MKYLYIHDMYIDLNRCQLHRNDQIISLEPKVTEVLCVLARHQGEVVSRQALLSEVWTGTVVETNALQRCITQLRKAFDDNAKSPQFIATHPKKGYSLIPEVRWQEHLSVHAHPGSQPQPAPHWWRQPALAAGAAVLTLSALAVVMFTPPQNSEPVSEAGARATVVENKTQMLPAALRQTNGFFAVYSPDGRFVVYPKLVEKQQGQLWARDLVNGREFQLTDRNGNYPYSAWSPDSKHIAYIAADTASECSSLLTRNVPRVKNEPHSESRVIDCSTATLLSPQWLTDSSLAWIEYHMGSATVMQHDTTGSAGTPLYDQPGVIPYYLTYSRQAQTLAVAQTTDENQMELVMLDPRSGESRVVFSKAVDPASSSSWHPVWNQDATGLLLTLEGKTVNIGLNGTVTPLALPYFPSQAAEL